VSVVAFDGQQMRTGSNSIPGLAESIDAKDDCTKDVKVCQEPKAVFFKVFSAFFALAGQKRWKGACARCD